jgi:hypothetical protein
MGDEPQGYRGGPLRPLALRPILARHATQAQTAAADTLGRLQDRRERQSVSAPSMRRTKALPSRRPLRNSKLRHGACTRCRTDDAAHPSTRAQGRDTLPEIKRKWPHRIALAADKVRSVESIVYRFANARSARRTFLLRHNDRDFVVFCFAGPEDAEEFRERFGGERLPKTQR